MISGLSDSLVKNGLWLLLALLLPALAFAGVHKHVKHKHWTNDYDRYFKKYSKRYFGPNFSWLWFKAQGIAESGLKPKAKSHAGAKGIMQIMPGTYKEIKKTNSFLGDVHKPQWNIAAGIYYDRQLYKKWQKRKVSADQRLTYTFSSYNAGFTRMLRIYNKENKKLGTPPEWQELEPSVPRETRNYVARINKLMQY